MPSSRNFELWKGNTFSLGLRFSAGGLALDLTGSELVFKAAWTDGALRKTTADDDGFDILSPQEGTARLSLSVAETRTLPTGEVKFEIERRIAGEQKTFIYGVLICSEWVNDD